MSYFEKKAVQILRSAQDDAQTVFGHPTGGTRVAGFETLAIEITLERMPAAWPASSERAREAKGRT